MLEKREILHTSDLTKIYDNTLAVDNLNIAINEGEVFGLLGPNGAGKTTTILMLLGLTEPTSGSAFINGLDCTREPIQVKRFVGYLPDSIGFYNDMTGLENLMFTARLNGLSENFAKTRAEKLLQRVGLSDEADKRAGGYSRGMRQRLGIADILMKDPKVIILDEPTLGIDPAGMHELLTLIRELAEKDGRTVVVSSHQLHQIQQICDRVGIFVKGRLIACGNIRELASQLGDESGCQIEVAVLNRAEKLEQLLKDIETVKSVTCESEQLIVHAQKDVRAVIAKTLIENDLQLVHLRLRSGDLDEIYRRYFEKEEKTDGRVKAKRRLKTEST